VAALCEHKAGSTGRSHSKFVARRDEVKDSGRREGRPSPTASSELQRFQDLADQCVSVPDQMTQLAEAKPDGKKTSADGGPSRALSGKSRFITTAAIMIFFTPGSG
jgi:hypothetical protein